MDLLSLSHRKFTNDLGIHIRILKTCYFAVMDNLAQVFIVQLMLALNRLGQISFDRDDIELRATVFSEHLGLLINLTIKRNRLILRFFISLKGMGMKYRLKGRG